VGWPLYRSSTRLLELLDGNMPPSVPDILALVERMEAREETGFGLSPETAPLVIEALRVYARMKTSSLINDLLEQPPNLSTASKYTAMNGIIYLGIIVGVFPQLLLAFAALDVTLAVGAWMISRRKA
jgi:hypothetical protein